MGLVNDKVFVPLNGRNISHYKKLGYVIPMYKDKRGRLVINKNIEIEVSIYDLPDKSYVVINYNCDNCDVKIDIIWRAIKNRINKKNYCENCFLLIYGAINHNSKIPKLLGPRIFISFYQWCIDNNRQDLLDRWDYIRNKLQPENIHFSTNKKYYFNCLNILHESELKSINTLTDKDFKKIKCKQCNSLGQWFVDNKINEKIFWSDKNKKSTYEYSKRENKDVYWKCENGVHEDYEREINAAFTYNFRCPKCVNERKESMIQEKIRLYLEELCEKYNWKLNHEYECELKCKNPKTKQNLRYDNEIIGNNFNLITETHGYQHFTLTRWHELAAKNNGRTAKEELEYIQWKDEYKKQNALDNGYLYLAIPYWKVKEEKYKSMINNVLKDFIKELS